MEKSFWKELLLLLIIAAVGLIICAVASVVAMLVLPNSVISLHIVQWTQTIFVMILPPILWYVLRIKGDPFKGLWVTNVNWTYVFFAVLFVICCIPAFEFINYLNSTLPLPTFLKEIVDRIAEENEKAINLLISVGGIGGWTELVLLMSIGTAIGEELMFRGGLLKCFSFTKLNHHWQAIFVGLIFSIIHFEPLGFVERWMLGTLLCYLVFWSGSLWPAIAMHAANNLVALIQYKCFGMTMSDENLEMEFGWPLVVLSFVVSALILFVCYNKKTKKYEDNTL